MDTSKGKNVARSRIPLWKTLLGDIQARSYFESCQSIGDFDYLGFLRFSESQQLTKDQCETQWNEALDQFILSTHKGLQAKGAVLKKRWQKKDHVSNAGVFWSAVKRKRELDKGTLEVQTAVDEYWNKRIRKEYSSSEVQASTTSQASSSLSAPVSPPILPVVSSTDPVSSEEDTSDNGLDLHRFRERFENMADVNKWRLPSGQYAENILYETGRHIREQWYGACFLSMTTWD